MKKNICKRLFQPGCEWLNR